MLGPLWAASLSVAWWAVATQAASNAATQQLSSITLVPPRQTMEEGHRWCPHKMGQSGGLGILWTRHLMGWTKLTFRCLPVVHETKRDSWRELPVLIWDPLKRSGEWLNCSRSRYQLFSWIFFLFPFFLQKYGMRSVYTVSVGTESSCPVFIPTIHHVARESLSQTLFFKTKKCGT